MDCASEASDTDESQRIIPYDELSRSARKSSASPIDDKQDPQKGSADIRAIDCPFCSCLIDTPYASLSTTEVQQSVFHEECQSCSPPDGAQISLCGFCEHLRLPHLLSKRCQGLASCSIDIDPNSRALGRAECDLCDFIANAIAFPLNGTSETETSLPNSAVLKGVGNWGSVIKCYGLDPTSSYDIGLEVKRSHAPDGISEDFEEFVQWNLVRRWLAECDEFHGKREFCPIRSTLPPGFQVIDVNKRCIVRQDHGCRFMALSYVWGHRSKSASYIERTTCNNIESLQLPGALAQLPETVEDTIEICKQLGIEYLWVDRYCIVQDDNVHKHSQIAAMAAIYSSSTVTVIACSGNDGVESGIPGVRRKRQWKRQAINIQGYKITPCLPHVNDLVRMSIWSTRGWTYQEAILSQRTLIMTSVETWFSCQICLRREDIDDLTPLYLWPGKLQNLDGTGKDGKMNTLAEYRGHVRQYTMRNLGDPSDIYNAFDGIARALFAEDCAFQYGLPESQFDQALLWYCGGRWHHPGSRCLRICEQTTPSWSWGSVTCIVKYDLRLATTLVKWVAYDAQTAKMSPEIAKLEISEVVHCKEIQATEEPITWNRPFSIGSDQNPRLYLALAIKEGCIKPYRPYTISENGDFATIQGQLDKWWRTYADAYKDIPQIGAHPSSRTTATLFTQAQSAFFHVESGLIKNNSGIVIGGVCQAKVDFEDRLLRISERYSNCEEDRIEEECNVEGIALSISMAYSGHILKLNNPDISTDDLGWEDAWGELLRDLTYFDCKGKPLLPIPMVNIMFISREGGYAQRIGLGWIVLKQWSFFDWTLKDIWLR